MGENEKVKATMQEAMQGFRADMLKIENDFAEQQKGLRIALSLYELAQKVSRGSNTKTKDIDFLMLDSLQVEFAQWYANYKTAKSGNPAEFVQDIKPIMDVMKLYYALMEEQESDTQEAVESEICLPELPEQLNHEIAQGLKTTQLNGETPYTNNNLIKTLLKRETTNEAGESLVKLQFTESDMTVKQGGKMSLFQYAVFCEFLAGAEAGRITSDGWMYSKDTDINRGLSGSNKDSLSPARVQEITEAVAGMNKDIKYSTSEELADILGIDSAQLDPNYTNIKVNAIEEPFANYKIVYGTERGKPIRVFMLKPAEVIYKILKSYPCFEIIENEVKCIKYRTAKGQVKEMTLTPKTISIRTCLITNIETFRRMRRAGKYTRGYIPYTSIFEECNIKGGYHGAHTQESKRVQESIAKMLNYWVEIGYISRWEEYKNQGDTKTTGIRVCFNKEALEME